MNTSIIILVLKIIGIVVLVAGCLYTEVIKIEADFAGDYEEDEDKHVVVRFVPVMSYFAMCIYSLVVTVLLMFVI